MMVVCSFATNIHACESVNYCTGVPNGSNGFDVDRCIVKMPVSCTCKVQTFLESDMTFLEKRTYIFDFKLLLNLNLRRFAGFMRMIPIDIQQKLRFSRSWVSCHFEAMGFQNGMHIASKPSGAAASRHYPSFQARGQSGSDRT